MSIIFIQAAKILKGTILVWLFMIGATLIVTFAGGILWAELTYNEEYLLRGFGLFVAGACLIYLLSKKNISIFKNFMSSIPTNLGSTKTFFTTVLLTLLFFSFCFFIAGSLNLYSIEYISIDYYDKALITHVILVGILANVFASVGEEILFRGFLLDYFDSFLQNRESAIIISSITFSIGHLHYTDSLNFILAFAGGITTGYGYLKFRTISIPIAIHFSYNLFNFIIASDSSSTTSIPYLFKIEYIRIADNLGAWIDLFILLSFVFIFGYLYIKTPDEQGWKKLDLRFKV